MSAPAPPREQKLRVVYVSPLRALAVDVDRNLRAPLEGIRLAAERLGTSVYRPEVATRTGDTPARERAKMSRIPPDILITTPESLHLMLTSKARETLRHIEAVIIDEIHALAPTKRNSHLALSLERLEHEVLHNKDAVAPLTPQRIALSATQRPLEEIARFLGGYMHSTGNGDASHDESHAAPRPVTIVDAGIRKELDLRMIVPVPDLRELGQQIPRDDDLDLASGPASAAPAACAKNSCGQTG